MLQQILSSSTIRNVWRTVWRRSMLMLGLKGLNVVSATNKDALTQSHNGLRIEPSIRAARDTSASNNSKGTPMTYIICPESGQELWFIEVVRVLVKCQQPAKKPATWTFEPSAFWGNRVKWESEILKLPTAFSFQAVYIYIIAVHFKT